MLKLYEDNGYANIPKITDFAIKNDVRTIFIVGGRGTGKTFGVLKYALENNLTFLYVRRKQNQLDDVKIPKKSPFSPINRELGYHVTHQKMDAFTYCFYHGIFDSKKQEYIPDGEPIGFTACATASDKARGFDLTDVELIIYDEFIPERTERAIRGEAISTLNLLATVTRNRELTGRKPPLIYLCANAMNMDNAIYNYLGFVDTAYDMERKRHTYRILKDRNALMIHLYDSPVSDKLSTTSIYKLAKGTDFVDMAVGNAFSFENYGKIKKLPVKEFNPLAVVGGITILEHKSMGIYYGIEKRMNAPNKFDDSDIEKLRFRREFPNLWESYIFNDFYFDTYSTELYFRSLFN